jgi:hypothetical protein
MFDLTNELFRRYITFAISLCPMDSRIWRKSIDEIKKKYSDKLSIDYRLVKKKHSYIYYFRQQKELLDKTIDFFMKIIMSDEAMFIIFSINHSKLDGALCKKIHNEIYDSYCKFEPNVTQLHRPVKIKCGRVFLPIKCSLIDSLVTKYPYSKNVIMQSIWPMYLNYKFNFVKFSQIISIRGDNSQNGNFLYVDTYNTSSNLKDTCETINQGVVNAKQIIRTQFTLPIALLSTYNSVLFNNWVSLCPKYCNGIYCEGFSDLNWHPFPNMVVIVIQNNNYVILPYYPSLPMWQTDMSDFNEFCKQF